jgi:hypothetical protein
MGKKYWILKFNMIKYIIEHKVLDDRRKIMSDKIKRKDIEFHEFKYCTNPEGKQIGIVKAKQISLFFNRDEISEDEVREIVESHGDDISKCECADERVVVMTTSKAEKLMQTSGWKALRPSHVKIC